MTLPIPDDQPDQAALAVLADYSHDGKQIQQKLIRSQQSAMLRASILHIALSLLGEKPPQSTEQSVQIAAITVKSRGPPAA